MSTDETQLLERQYFRPATLAQFRWVAILGQLSAVFVARFVLGMEFEILSVLIVIGLWAILNILQQTLFSHRLRMDMRSGFIALLVDLIEIAIVLDLTGGLNNPFAVFIAVPAVLAATTLGRRALIVLIVTTILALMVIDWHAEPIILNGSELTLPPVLRLAEFIALVVLILFLSFYARRATLDNLRITNALAASELALQREHRLSSLGALVAAYAHELGTPLATIRMTAKELLREDIPDAVKPDINVILEEATRSADILTSMGERGRADSFIKTVPFSSIVEEAAAPHLGRGKAVIFDLNSGGAIYVERSEAIIQGLRNIIQNAVDFAKSEVTLSLNLSPSQIALRIEDDGGGFPSEAIAKAGEPYVQSANSHQRRNYQGMGLGVFIAKTLLERSGANMQFANRPRPEHGAVVLITWPRSAIEIDKKTARQALGQNQVQTE